MKLKDGCSLEESYDQPRQHFKKQRHCFANEVPPSQAHGFSSSHVSMWELNYKESWVSEDYALELWCWRRLSSVPWTARVSNQTILKEINCELSLEGLMLKLKLQYFLHLKWRADSLEKIQCWERLRAGGEGGNRGWDGWMASSTQWTQVWANSVREWRTGKPGMLQSKGSQTVRHDLATEQQLPH